ncbi:MAG: hypothetical protein ABI207_06190 [Crocinitomicaceae bacterium]
MKLLTIFTVALCFPYVLRAQDTIIDNKKEQRGWGLSDFDLHMPLFTKEDSLKYFTSYKAFKTNISDLYFIKGFFGNSDKVKVEGFSLYAPVNKIARRHCRKCYSFKRIGTWKYYSFIGNLLKIEYYDNEENIIDTKYYNTK